MSDFPGDYGSNSRNNLDGPPDFSLINIEPCGIIRKPTYCYHRFKKCLINQYEVIICVYWLCIFGCSLFELSQNFESNIYLINVCLSLCPSVFHCSNFRIIFYIPRFFENCLANFMQLKLYSKIRYCTGRRIFSFDCSLKSYCIGKCFRLFRISVKARGFCLLHNDSGAHRTLWLLCNSLGIRRSRREPNNSPLSSGQVILLSTYFKLVLRFHLNEQQKLKAVRVSGNDVYDKKVGCGNRD
jgi:hypothetical protein